MMILNKTYGFVGEHALVAPQAENAMAAVARTSDVRWRSTLASLGIEQYFNCPHSVRFCSCFLLCVLFLSSTLPLLAGGAIAWFVSTRSKDETLNTARKERGTLLASGFIAGGALMGVVSAVLRFGGINLLTDWMESNGGELLALGMYLLIIFYLAWDSLRAKRED
ncbi:hypothetical protein MASR1M46_17580 [Bacteroidales bacterium]